jgi:hypothetical protein
LQTGWNALGAESLCSRRTAAESSARKEQPHDDRRLRANRRDELHPDVLRALTAP